jgi:hypothetical protein
MVPVRFAPLFSSTVYSTVPSPFDDAPDAMCTHGVSVFAVHGQPSPDLTLNVPGDLFDPTVVPEGEMEILQLFFVVSVTADEVFVVCACCFTVTVLPATCTVPVRGAPDLFDSTVYGTLPLPVPLAVKTLIQSALVFALHWQRALLALRVTLRGADTPALGSGSVPCQGTVILEGETLKVQVPE